VKTTSGPLETQRSDFQGFNAVKIAHQIDVLMNGSLAMRIRVTDVEPAGAVPAATFALPGHEWERQFTSEVR
jgi:hypothetical protein